MLQIRQESKMLISSKHLQMSDYIPALRFKFLTRIYDKLLSVTFPEEKIKQALIDQLQLAGNETILDFGCGTGTLAIMIKEQFPLANIMCVDIDEEIIGIAYKKINARKLNMNLFRVFL